MTTHWPHSQGWLPSIYSSGIEVILQSDSPITSVREPAAGSDPFLLRAPIADDGPRVCELIAACPPLDRNSLYCNLLQCTDFASTCVVAERSDKLVGWISGYVPPVQSDVFFVWQVAVAAEARGEGVALRMLDWLLDRPAASAARLLTTTITEANASSWALFSAFARRRGSTLGKVPRFERDVHFQGAHDTEWEVRIPLADLVRA